MTIYHIKRDGKLIETFNTENDAWARLLKIQCQSVDWAMKYEGWAIVKGSNYDV